MLKEAFYTPAVTHRFGFNYVFLIEVTHCHQASVCGVRKDVSVIDLENFELQNRAPTDRGLLIESVGVEI